MRYVPAERLFRLALLLAATHTGLTLDEMASTLGVGRRTVERLRDTLIKIFPLMNSWDDDANVRRWRLPGSVLAGLVAVRPETVVAIETSARECDVRGEADRALLLREAALALQAMMRPELLLRAEPDIEALMVAEGVAMRPGPRQMVANGVLTTLREAIKGFHQVEVCYKAADATVPRTSIVCPYGIIHGGYGYLVVNSENSEPMWTLRLDRIVSVGLTDRIFTRRKDFDMAAHAAQSFGLFQEEPFDVTLRFTPERSDEAAGWMFHPSQSMNREADGSLIVRFRAGGALEMAWHLFTWGTNVTIIAPEHLRAGMTELLVKGAEHHGRSP
jgi:predicted DNA-binding transcriptional regulator YafY